MKKEKEYTPFSEEWIKEVMKLPKRDLVEFFKNKCIESANRGAFIDWCAEHHAEILREYTGFTEAAK